ncbi:DUF2249 domain-containing protein [Halopelagius longus]|uniref:DUF2249 domain-containing protein n=1 Tax=Halopelagius longus TaxID=1236180 RepID=A0A1H1FJW4_9EURY|nr:DUF2249 domain-containing protein [Halopelagius longus]RDI70217.1 DUF2249 domain-containing protein [Halopelagius longus]SDR01205.1 Uncharacterized conserved protein [Halopelagius longus]
MATTDPSLDDLPTDELPVSPSRPIETLDARELPPPQPLQKTLELLAELDDETAVVQLNDRAPQHLYPRLSERGYEYETTEFEEYVVTTIWKPQG